MTSLDPSITSLPRSIEYARTHNRLPQRALPKNKTGAFVEGHNGPQNYRTIPPLARPRGAPGLGYTPSYSRQSSQKMMTHSTNGDKLLILSSATLISLYCKPMSPPPVCLPLSPALFLRVPNVYPKQKQTVQNIRARQEWKGGFFPQPVKKKKSKELHERLEHRPSPHLLNGLPAYRELTKRSARNYVAAANNGVTHLEDIRSESMSSSSIRGDCVYDTDDLDLRSLKRLEEVCKTIEREETWMHTTRQGVGRLTSGKKQSPLLIRSFRNPQNPHPVVQYTDIREVQHHSGKDHFISRPPVPAPYFYNSRTLPRASDNGGSRVHLSRLSGARSSEHILAAPGVGFLTKAALGLTGERTLAEGVKGQPPPAISPRGKQTESSDERVGMMDKFRVPSTTPATSIPDLQRGLEEASERQDHVSLPDCDGNEINEDQKSIEKLTERMELGQSEPSMPARITLSLETVDGVSRSINLDEEEARNRQDVLEYHAVEKTILGITHDASDPIDELKKEGASDGAPGGLDQLLSEHSEIVTQINELERRTPSDDENNAD